MANMKVISVAEATGPALDWLVAKCEGLKLYRNALLNGQVKEDWWVSGYYMDSNNWIPLSLLNFSTSWAQGGPIIERERIDINAKINAGSDFDEWRASIGVGASQRHRYGDTPLVAAMRCYVANKLGKTAEVPEELT